MYNESDSTVFQNQGLTMIHRTGFAKFGLALLLFTLIALAGSAADFYKTPGGSSAAFAEESPVASVMIKPASLRLEPSVRATKIKTARKGWKVTVLKRSENMRWLMVRLDDGIEGWLPAESVGEIKETETVEVDLEAEPEDEDPGLPEQAPPAAAPAEPKPKARKTRSGPDPWGIAWAAEFKKLTPIREQPSLSGLIFLEPSAMTGGGDWRLVAVDAATGTIRWTYKPYPKAARTSNILPWGGGLAFALSDKRLVVLSILNGKEVKSQALPEQNVGLMTPCGKNLCFMQAEFSSTSLPAATNIFFRALPRRVSKLDMGVWDPNAKKFVSHYPILRLGVLPSAIIVDKKKLAVVMPEGDIEVYGLDKVSREPLKRYQAPYSEWLIQDGTLAWINANQLFTIPPDKVAATPPVALPVRSRDFMAYGAGLLSISRNMKEGISAWSFDRNTMTEQRIGDWTGDDTFHHQQTGGTVALSHKNRSAILDHAARRQIVNQAMPWLDDLNARPLYSSSGRFVAVVESGSAFFLFGLAPIAEMKPGAAETAFGKALDPTSGYRLLSGPGKAGQWPALEAIFEKLIQRKGGFEARCNCLEAFGSPETVKKALTRMLATRNRWLAPLAMGEWPKYAADDPPEVLLDLYFAAQLKRGTAATEASKIARALAADWPEGWKDEDLQAFSQWCLDQLIAANPGLVAPIFRNRLKDESLPYPERLKAFRFLAGRYEQEKKLLNGWYKALLKWERKAKRINRKIPHPDAEDLLVTLEHGNKKYGVFMFDFPFTGSMWLYIQHRGAKSGSIYSMGQVLTPRNRTILNNITRRYNRLPSDVKQSRRPPVDLEMDAANLVLTLRYPSEEKVITFRLDSIKRDRDRDGLTDIEEKDLGLGQRKRDSDSDGILDGLDTNPLASHKEKMNDNQQITQAVYVHRMQTGKKPEPIPTRNPNDFQRFHWVDFGGLRPAELPTKDEAYLVVTEEGTARACSFVKPDEKLPLKPPEGARFIGPIAFSKPGNEAWVGLSCAKRDVTNYYLLQLDKHWIALDAASRSLVPEADEKKPEK